MLPPSWQTSLPEHVVSEIDRAAREHSVIALGEGDHCVAEKYAYRLALISRLAKVHGLRHITNLQARLTPPSGTSSDAELARLAAVITSLDETGHAGSCPRSSLEQIGNAT